jgi:glycosyltransferase involved in cell wall biosynthesis
MKYAQRDLQEQELPWDPFVPIPSSFAEVVQEEVALGTDLCQVEFVEMMSIASLLPDSIPKIFIHHQIHFIYNNLTWADVRNSAYLKYLIGRQRAIELGQLREYDALVTFSEDDRKILDAEVDLPPVSVSAFPVPADMKIVSEAPSAFSGRFCFLGSEEHPPNRDGLAWLLDVLWPAISTKVGKTELLIFGMWNEDWQKRAKASGETVRFTGFVPDLGSALLGGILLVPIRVGSGIRTKILAALSQATPCVATTIAAEGLATGFGGGVIRADSEGDFVDAAVELATRPECWKARADAGPEYVRKFHSPEAVRFRRNEIYLDVIKRYQTKKKTR